jgi:hypothetical protein
MTAPEVTCVVDKANPRCDDTRMVAAELVSAAKHCGAWMSVILLPTVRMMRRPPSQVPSAMARPHDTITQNCGPDPQS